MKKIYNLLILSFILITGFASAVTHSVTVLGSSFSPSTLNVNVGDTIIWTLGSGSHTTTSMTVPSGAQTWDNPINGGSPTFSYPVLVEGNYTYMCTPHGFMGSFTAINTGIKTPTSFSGFIIYNVRPAVYNLSYSLTHSSIIKISLYDLTGKSVKVLSTSVQVTGDYSNTYNFDDLPRGIYIIEMRIDRQRLSKRLIID